jgi:hypothetical protein
MTKCHKIEDVDRFAENAGYVKGDFVKRAKLESLLVGTGMEILRLPHDFTDVNECFNIFVGFRSLASENIGECWKKYTDI